MKPRDTHMVIGDTRVTQAMTKEQAHAEVVALLVQHFQGAAHATRRLSDALVTASHELGKQLSRAPSEDWLKPDPVEIAQRVVGAWVLWRRIAESDSAMFLGHLRRALNHLDVDREEFDERLF